MPIKESIVLCSPYVHSKRPPVGSLTLRSSFSHHFSLTHVHQNTIQIHCLTQPSSTTVSLRAAMRSVISCHINPTSLIHTQLIQLDPYSHKGYERKHAALHSMGRYSEAFEAFRTMLSKLEQSPDPQTHGRLFCPYCRQQRVLNNRG